MAGKSLREFNISTGSGEWDDGRCSCKDILVQEPSVEH